jgi:hypothetical protein
VSEKPKTIVIVGAKRSGDEPDSKQTYNKAIESSYIFPSEKCKVFTPRFDDAVVIQGLNFGNGKYAIKRRTPTTCRKT